MLAQRYIAICDHKDCKAKCRATVVLKMVPIVEGSMSPIALVPSDVRLPEDWSWGWNPKKRETEIGCPKHKAKR